MKDPKKLKFVCQTKNCSLIMWNSNISNPNAPKRNSGRQQPYGQYGQPPPGPPPQGQQKRPSQPYVQRAFSHNTMNQQQMQQLHDDDNKGKFVQIYDLRLFPESMYKSKQTMNRRKQWKQRGRK